MSKKEAPSVAVEELPKAIVRRVVTEKLARLSGGRAEDLAVHKEALLAFSESARVFIHYLSATANDICKESKRQTMNAEDVLKALEEIDFPEFIEPLRFSLEEFRRRNAAKRSGTKGKETKRKREMEEELSTQNVDDGGGDSGEEGKGGEGHHTDGEE